MKHKNITLIGPVYPYKSGIAHYTGLLCRALSKIARVHMVSYQFQYPKLLFKKEQKDYTNDSFRVEGTDYLIHTVNPINWLSVGRKLKKERPDAVVISWWHPYFAPCYYVMCKALGKRTKKLFLCHNVFPHERFPMDRLLTKMVLRQGDAFILHSSTEADALSSIKQDARYRVQVHPTYDVFQFEQIGRDEARKRLGIGKEEKMLLFFGFVRPYKGLQHLIRAMKPIREAYADARLYVVGDFGGSREVYEGYMDEAGVRSAITVKDGYTPDREVEPYFAAADLVVLPYESATQSGIVQMAYGFERPVIVTRVGGLPEVVTDGETGYVVEPEDPQALAEAVIRFYADKKAEEFHTNIAKEAERFSWDNMAKAIGELLFS